MARFLQTFQLDSTDDFQAFSGRNHIEARLVGGAIASQVLSCALMHSIHSLHLIFANVSFSL